MGVEECRRRGAGESGDVDDVPDPNPSSPIEPGSQAGSCAPDGVAALLDATTLRLVPPRWIHQMVEKAGPLAGSPHKGGADIRAYSIWDSPAPGR